ncbi:MAG TPA: hypothetical protein VFP91_13330 [Vicinamibacterales bacterium]|nr:hypothetical protein [Vicinamibacterales bacterium]
MTTRIVLAVALALSMGGVDRGHPASLGKIGPHCLILRAQNEELPAPGNPGHTEPGPGEHCVHAANDPAHNCSCHRECKQNTDDDGNPVPGGHVEEDPKCRVYCFKDHCHCPVSNCE